MVGVGYPGTGIKVAVHGRVKPMYLRRQKQDNGAQSSGPLCRPLLITVLHGQTDIFIGKIENTDAMYYTKKGFHSITKALLGGNKSWWPPALGR